ncbi:MAG TPA: tyrosine-type recombinase/integrase [Armatimonadota bacterium]|nr:tyrosine-type recombinase/integrase [Armatimonadota bacterium]
MLDTGLRVSELCSLTVGDVDPETKALSVQGKGGKRRAVYLSTAVRRALWRYVEHERRLSGEDEPLFVASRGRATDAGLTPDQRQVFFPAGDSYFSRSTCLPHCLCRSIQWRCR